MVVVLFVACVVNQFRPSTRRVSNTLEFPWYLLEFFCPGNPRTLLVIWEVSWTCSDSVQLFVVND